MAPSERSLILSAWRGSAPLPCLTDEAKVSEGATQQLRDRIVEAAWHVMRERGLAATRTSAIAEAAGCAEGSIYRYFDDKPQLLLAAIRSHLPETAGTEAGVLELAGTRTVRDNLLGIAQAACELYRDLVPLTTALLADATLVERRGEAFGGHDFRPSHTAAAVAAYLTAEQRLGRVRHDADPELAARLLVNGCVGESLIDGLFEPDRPRGRGLAPLVSLVMRELDPEGAA